MSKPASFYCFAFFVIFILSSIPLVGCSYADDAVASKPAFRQSERIAVVGNSTAERMNLYGNFETRLHLLTTDNAIRFRNFGWPADEVGIQQRPNNYTKIDDPLTVYKPTTLICFFGFNESFAGSDAASIDNFKQEYQSYISKQHKKFSTDTEELRFILIGPTAFEDSGNSLQPAGDEINPQLTAYNNAVRDIANENGHFYVNVFDRTLAAFEEEPGCQFTINGVHLTETGDQLVSDILVESIFSKETIAKAGSITPEAFGKVRQWVNDKSWYHMQDYRMLNGWYVYGGRRTFDTKTFPSEYRKIRAIVNVRDQYIWDLAANREVPKEPDDSNTGEVVIPETMFGSRDDNFRAMREPEQLIYPTPEEAIAQMSVPDGFHVELFASEREYPELANPNQIAFDGKGRLWVSCMPNYPQWQPGAERPSDRLLILEDTDKDGKADKCTTFYDKLICPTGFEFWDGGVLVVDEPRILFLKDTDGDDKADVVEQLLDGIATDDTHHTIGAWEFSHGGKLHMLEGIQLSTTLETPWGPFRNKNYGGAYIFDPRSQKLSHYRTPGYGNPWCLVFDQWGNGIVGDGTNARQHWISPLAGKEVPQRRTCNPVFDNEGMRPAVGNEFLLSRHLPDEVQGQFIYSCVINMHGFPRFELQNDAGAGYEGNRIADLLSSSDNTFRPVDPKIGPDGAIWFGDWCNALIGHMQYSQRDPNRDHEHGRVYRLVYDSKPLLDSISYEGQSIDELLDQLAVPELRTRYRIRRELRRYPKEETLTVVNEWLAAEDRTPLQMCEALWLQESHNDLDKNVLDRLAKCDDYQARAAAMHVIGNQIDYLDDAFERLTQGVHDSHPRVRLEAIRGLSFYANEAAFKATLQVTQYPMDYWLDYTLEHCIHAFELIWKPRLGAGTLPEILDENGVAAIERHRRLTGPGGRAVRPLEIADNTEASIEERRKAIQELATLRGGKAERGQAVFKQVCSACHIVDGLGKKFGPELSDIGSRMSSVGIVTSIVMPNDEIAKGYETVAVVTEDDEVINGFIFSETDSVLSLGIANGKRVDIAKEEIVERVAVKASSMPEGLAKTIAPSEFIDLLAYLTSRRGINKISHDDGWFSTEELKPAPLRKKDGLTEISRSARMKFERGFDPWHAWNSQAHLFTQTVGPASEDFAFHSTHSVEQPSVLLKLPENSQPRKIWIANRRNPVFYKRASELAVWVSTDGKEFDLVWEANKPAAEYWIDLPENSGADYIRIGLKGQGTFHLYQATVYGE